MAHRCFCGAFVAQPTTDRRHVRCASCGASWRVPASKAQRSEAGRMGARARVANQTTEQRRDIARKAAEARWAKVKEGQ